MKKKVSKILIAMSCMVIVGFSVGCGTTSAIAKDSNNVLEASKDEIDKIVIVDWTDRVLGEVSAPQWLKNLSHGNADLFKQNWGIDSSRVVKLSRATGKTEATAQALSRSGFAYTQAAELNQKVIGRVGQGLNDVGQLEALYLAASETKAEMSGLREETGFFQKIRRTNAETGDKTEDYIYYTVYSMDKSTWDNICKKYLMDVMGGADLTTETQKKIGALFSEMKDDADKKEASKQVEEEKLYKVQMARLEAERAKTNAEATTSSVESTKAKEIDSKDSQIKAAVQGAIDLASFLL